MNKPPEPKYLNLDFLFNAFFILLRLFMEKLISFAEWLSRQKIISIIISIILLIGIAVVIYKIRKLREKKAGLTVADIFGEEEKLGDSIKKWENIKKQLDSENPSDWKMAIMQADSLIDEIIKKIVNTGENLGERLKSIEPSDLESLDDIWEAHKVRNRIAHDPDTFILEKDEAIDIIAKYEKALKELEYI